MLTGKPRIKKALGGVCILASALTLGACIPEVAENMPAKRPVAANGCPLPEGAKPKAMSAKEFAAAVLSDKGVTFCNERWNGPDMSPAEAVESSLGDVELMCQDQFNNEVHFFTKNAGLRGADKNAVSVYTKAGEYLGFVAASYEQREYNAVGCAGKPSLEKFK